MTEARSSYATIRTIGRLDRWPLYLATLVFLADFLRLAGRAMFVFPARTDFRYFWVAGKVWSQGASPYSPLFGKVKTALVGNSIADIWLYPPTWYPICRVFAAMPLSLGKGIWSGLILLSLLGSIIGWRSYRAVGGPLNQFWFTLVSIATVAAVPTFRTVLYGQTSAFVFLGANLLLFGALRRNTVCAVLGAYLVMLKPTFGIPLCTAAVLMPGLWRSIVIAGAVTIVSMLPAFQTDTPSGILGGIARNTDSYARYWFNAPDALTGFFHFLDRLGFARPSITVMLFAGIVPILTAFGCLRLRTASRDDTIISLFVVGVSSMEFFTLPHRYDLLSIYALAIPIWHFRPWLVIGLCALPIVACRTLNLEYLSLAAAITWCAAMATAVLPRPYTIRRPLRGHEPVASGHGATATGQLAT